MAGVYSTQFISDTVPAGAGLSYTVPEGYTGILRDLDVVGLVDTTTVYSMEVNGLVEITRGQGGGPGAQPMTGEWRGRQVIPAGTVVTVNASTGVSVSLSGYLLQD